jgi:alkaline phosphatase
MTATIAARRHAGRISAGLLILVLAGVATAAAAHPETAEIVRLGIVADIHAHDIDSPFEGKYMSNTESRLAAFTDAMNAWPADVIVELGDFVNGWVVLGADPGDPGRLPEILTWADGLLAAFHGPRLHVIGNHDVYNLTKEQYRARLGLDSTYYSVDIGPFRIVVLDVQFTEDGRDLAHTYTGVAGAVSDEELLWLQQELASTSSPTIVCVHQMLDIDDPEWGRPLVANAPEVRRILADSGVVVAVFQGHAHDNRHTVIDGIHYVTFEALVDQGTPPSWACVTLDPAAGTIEIRGVGDQASLTLAYEIRR